MEGTTSVLFVREGSETQFLAAAEDYLSAIAESEDLLYADLHGTKYPNKFVLLEMYRDAGARERQAAAAYKADWLEIRDSLLTEAAPEERIRPLISSPPQRARPVDADADNKPAPIACPIDTGCNPCGAFVRVFVVPATAEEFITKLERQGDLVAEYEPGFQFADFYRFDTPGHWLVVEYYDDRKSLSHHHTLPHTLEFSDMKATAGYETQKHQAFTMHPIRSVGPWARDFQQQDVSAAAR